MHKSYGTGRRKTSNARVYLKEGTGEITINSKNLDDFVSSETLKSFVLAPLEKTKMEKKVDLKIESSLKRRTCLSSLYFSLISLYITITFPFKSIV